MRHYVHTDALAIHPRLQEYSSATCCIEPSTCFKEVKEAFAFSEEAFPIFEDELWRSCAADPSPKKDMYHSWPGRQVQTVLHSAVVHALDTKCLLIAI